MLIPFHLWTASHPASIQCPVSTVQQVLGMLLLLLLLSVLWYFMRIESVPVQLSLAWPLSHRWQLNWLSCPHVKMIASPSIHPIINLLPNLSVRPSVYLLVCIPFKSIQSLFGHIRRKYVCKYVCIGKTKFVCVDRSELRALILSLLKWEFNEVIWLVYVLLSLLRKARQ